jgi:hypothetical protein
MVSQQNSFESAMKRKSCLMMIVVLASCLLPAGLAAQSYDPAVPLGDFARSLRRSKAPPARTVIDNDNLAQVMDDVETRRLSGRWLFSFDGPSKNFQVSSPDVTCSLSFSAQATALLSNPFAPRELPESELAKLSGPATISGDTLNVSVYNGSGWDLREITIGLTLLRHADARAAYYGTAKLIPAAATSVQLAEKPSDTTVLYHLKGAAAPLTTTVFSETLGTPPGPDQEWHWAIVQAKGMPPQ